MFNPKYLESGEFYRRRYLNFPSLVIVPLFMLLAFVVIFSVFGQREITTKSVGVVIPRHILSTIQSTSSNMIDTNYLAENKRVKVGDQLVIFKHSDEQTATDLLQTKLKNTNERIDSLNNYLKSVEAGTSQFSSRDQFGYDNLFTDYIAQINTLSADFKQQALDKSDAITQANQQKSAFQDIKDKNSNKIAQYQAVLNAINANSDKDLTHNDYKYIYSDFATKLSAATTTDEKSQVKQDAVTTVKQQIEQLENANDDYASQIAGIVKSGPLSANSTNDKISSLKSQQLAGIQKEINDQQQAAEELKAQQQETNTAFQDTTITANQNGLIHLMYDKTNQRYFPKGSIIAQIYPDLNVTTPLDVEFYVPASHIVGIKKQQIIRFSVNQNIKKPLVLNGQITSIDTAATETKQGNVYRLVAKLDVPNDKFKQIRYGLTGRVVIIKTHKSWFNYYKDIILGDQ